MKDWQDNTDLAKANAKVSHLINILAIIESDWAFDGMTTTAQHLVRYELGNGLSKDRKDIERQHTGPDRAQQTTL